MKMPNKNNRNFYKLIICLWFFFWPAEAADLDLNSTQEYVEKDDGLANNLSFEECLSDLQNRFSARYQINTNLKLTSYQDYDQKLLQLPMLCIGTGRDLAKLPLVHICRTMIQEIDVCIDLQAKIKPDLVCDCFQINYTLLLHHGPFGSIFFAHVGSCALPIDAHTKASLQNYYNRLISGGLFVYNSEVIYIKALDILVSAHDGATNFEKLKLIWISLLGDVGFERIEVRIKDESKYFLEESISILIIAEKADK